MPNYDDIKFKFFTSANDNGHFRLPDQFYNGVTFGVSIDNPFITHVYHIIYYIKCI